MTIVLDHPSPAPSRSVDSPESPPRASTHRRANTAPVGVSKTASEVAAAPVIVRGVRQSYGGVRYSGEWILLWSGVRSTA